MEAFIEHEQDRGNKITTIRTSLVSVQAFLQYMVEEGIVSQATDIDTAVRHGLGFPAEKQGILAWADQMGAAKIVELLKPLEPLGEQFRATETLKECAKNGSALIDG